MSKFSIESEKTASGFRRPERAKVSEGAASEENLRLKKMLKRAVEKEFAPQSLIDSIRSQIRR